MSWIERKAPGNVVAHVPLNTCLRKQSRRRMPADVEGWARALPVRPSLIEAGLSRVLRETVVPVWSAWMGRFQQGLRIEQDGDSRVIVHCDTVRYRIDPTGEIHAEAPRWGGGYEALLVEVGTPFPSWYWVRTIAFREAEAFAPLLSAIHAHRLAEPPRWPAVPGDKEGVAFQWLGGVVEGLARRCIDGLQMRRLLREVLAPDPRLMDLARRARPRAHGKCDVSSAWWNQCLAHREALVELHRTAPALLPFYGELMQRNQVQPGRLDWAALRFRLGGEELQPAQWRFLMHEPAAPVWQMYRDGQIRSLGNLRAFLACWARLHLAQPPGVRLPRALWEPLARTSVDPARGDVLPPIVWPGTARATRQAIEHYRSAAARGDGPAFIENEWGPVVRWGANYAAGIEMPRVRGWSSARRLAREDERRVRARNSNLSWHVPVPSLEDGGLQAVALANGAELADEAIAMRHCADRYALRCANGELLVYSLRDAATGKRRASAAIGLGRDGAMLLEVGRSLNRPPDSREIALAEKLANAVCAAVRARVLAESEIQVPIPPVGPKVLFMERKDSDVYAFVESTGCGWKGYKFSPCGSARPISGDEAIETLNPDSWSPMSREDFVGAVEVLRTLRRHGRTKVV